MVLRYPARLDSLPTGWRFAPQLRAMPALTVAGSAAGSSAFPPGSSGSRQKIEYR